MSQIDRPFTAEEITEALNRPDVAKFDKLVGTYLDAEELYEALEPHMVSFYESDPGIIFVAGLVTALTILYDRNEASNVSD